MCAASTSRAAHTLGVAVVGGLLSSSCCVLQLVLNALSVGCAGFSLLSPYRPFFLAVTGGCLGIAHWRSRNTRRTLLALALSISLALTPELLRCYVEGRPPLPPPLARLLLHAKAGWPTALSSSASGSSLQQGGNSAATEPAWAEVELHAEGIRCAACAARVRHAVLTRAPGARECAVDFETGRVAAAGPGVSSAAVAAAVEELGYTVRPGQREAAGASAGAAEL